MNTADKIKVMQAFLDGKKIGIGSYGGEIEAWIGGEPQWCWGTSHYCIIETKPSIDWSQVSEKFRFLATDDDGRTYMYVQEPELTSFSWYSQDHASADVFKSFKKGDVDWKDSLVKRPETKLQGEWNE